MTNLNNCEYYRNLVASSLQRAVSRVLAHAQCTYLCVVLLLPSTLFISASGMTGGYQQMAPYL